jgi:hypothetical protein
MAQPNNLPVKNGTTEQFEHVFPKSDIDVFELQDKTSTISQDENKRFTKPPTTARDLVSEVLAVEDDPSINPWTFRMWFLGIGISIFAS